MSVFVPESPSKADASAIERAGVSGLRISMESGLWATAPLLSETWRVKPKRPSCAGCPEMRPARPVESEAGRQRPLGQAPEAGRLPALGGERRPSTTCAAGRRAARSCDREGARGRGLDLGGVDPVPRGRRVEGRARGRGVDHVPAVPGQPAHLQLAEAAAEGGPRAPEVAPAEHAAFVLREQAHQDLVGVGVDGDRADRHPRGQADGQVGPGEPVVVGVEDPGVGGAPDRRVAPDSMARSFTLRSVRPLPPADFQVRPRSSE